MFEIGVAEAWSWSIPVLNAEFLSLMLVNFALGILITFILKKMMKMGIALILVILILWVYAGTADMSYSGVMDNFLPTLMRYSDVLGKLFTQQLPWSGIAMALGFIEGYYHVRMIKN